MVAATAAGAAGQGQTGTVTPLFRFAWITDMHLDAGKTELVAGALRHADSLKPAFVLITGDNNAHPCPEDTGRPEPVTLRRQRFLKDFLQKNLESAAVIIPGDNWPQDFDKVFGPMQYSFDFGGLHFLLMAPDRSCHAVGAEGLSAFDPATVEWIVKDLDGSGGKPVIAAIHEPIYPPAFLDAPRLRDLMRGRANVVAVLQGHLHVDMAFVADGRTYLLGPSLGASADPRFKLLCVFPSHISVVTFAARGKDGGWEQLDGERRIDIPEKLRGGLERPAGGFKMENFSGVPAHPHVDDPSLAGRRGELAEILRNFLRGRSSLEKDTKEGRER